MKPLTLVHFSSRRLVKTLVDRLISFGYDIDVKEGEGWVCHERGDQHVVLFMGLSTYPKDKLLSELKASCHPRIFCVFYPDFASWDSDLIDCCSDFMGWPCDEQELAMRLERLYTKARPEPNIYDEDRVSIDDFLRLNLLGQAPVFLRTLELIQKVARYEVPVLIEGETGTGKELAAHAIHYLSVRRDYPFIPVNCGALAETLLENELFGHVKGAYTDAKTMQPGLITQAEGGTLFLDEVDSLSPKAQVSLLRFLQDKKYTPLGGGKVYVADVRVITASNRPLVNLVRSDQFREDLFFRINVMSITMPPLRERPGDAQLIAEHFIQRYREQYKCHDKYLHPDFLEWIARHPWPGNIRELENTVHREFLLADKAVAHTAATYLLQEALQEPAPSDSSEELFNSNLREAKARLVRQFEQRYLANLLAETQGNVTLAAKRAGKERRAFGKLLKKHGIDRVHFVGEDRSH